MNEFKSSGEFATTWVGGLGLIQGEEIVRCRDCKHFGRYLEEPWDKCELHGFSIGPNDGKEPDGFCAWGAKVVERIEK